MPSAFHVACATDEHYAPYCAAMLHSLFAHNPGAQVQVHYLHPPTFAPALLDGLRRLARRHGAEIHFHKIDADLVAGLPGWPDMSQSLWYRIFLASLLPTVDRVLYLDADTLVLDNVAELWRTELKDRPLAAALNPIDPARRHQMADLGLPGDVTYFNSGVLLMDLRAWRAHRYADRIREIVRQGDLPLHWPDQDVLNVVFRDNYVRLHPRWNCQNTLFFRREWAAQTFGSDVVEEALRHPAVLHFEGPGIGKPWHYFSPHPYRARYWRHLRRTGLPVPQPEGRTIKTVFMRNIQWIPAPLRSRLHWTFLRASALVSRR